ncbi:MAG: ABC transporter permease [Phycisphaerae bacterium]|nr:ABC transporter permease [Gemmatimonadaceae bacterium]
MKRLRVDARLLWGTAILVVLIVCALLAPAVGALMGNANPTDIGDVLATRLVRPLGTDGSGKLHWLGTDAFGRDVLARLWLGARISLGVGVVGSSLAGALGIALGMMAAWRGGATDRVILAISDALLAIPRLVLLLVVATLWGPGLVTVVVILALTGWMSVARLVRADVLGVRALPYVEAAEALGVPTRKLLLGHVLPNALGSARVAITLGIGNAMLLESGLSFLGLGVQPPTASWGNMISGGRDWLLIAPWIALSPGLALILTVVACTLIGDALTLRVDARAQSSRPAAAT